ncbi:hypothetical protein [Mucilaginibacter sp.]|uniref:hypothetical protein n=1 Tax=Mucilaginibacter sp. TaxID=1882438 RepID=UPI003AFFF16C
MDDNNRKNIQEEIGERLDSNEENINNLVKKNAAIEKQLGKILEIKIPDYSEAIETLTREVRESRENDQSSQLLASLRAINNKLDKVPKSAIKQLRILLFPEVNPGQYYKIVFGRLIAWAFCFMVATYIFISSSKAIEIYRYNKDVSQSVHYGRAWLYLQQHAKKKVLSAMDQAYEKTADK